jgi:hypothetical protein
MAAAFAAGGVQAFARELYGTVWTPTDAPTDPAAVANDLAMFRGFEPRPPALGAGTVVVTVGEHSSPVRYAAAEKLREAYGYPVRVLPGCGHAAHLQAASVLAYAIHDLLPRP